MEFSYMKNGVCYSIIDEVLNKYTIKKFTKNNVLYKDNTLEIDNTELYHIRLAFIVR